MNTIIGWQVTRDLQAGTMKIDQSAFIRDLIEEESMSDCNSVNIPMKAGNFIDIPEADNYEEADLKTYQRLVGKLMYLLCETRPDIAFVVGQLSRRNADPRVSYFKAAKRVVRYLKGTMHLGLTYGSPLQFTEQTKAPIPTNTEPYSLIGYADSNYAGDPEDQKLVMGYCFYLNGAVISWCSKKQ